MRPASAALTGLAMGAASTIPNDDGNFNGLVGSKGLGSPLTTAGIYCSDTNITPFDSGG